MAGKRPLWRATKLPIFTARRQRCPKSRSTPRTGARTCARAKRILDGKQAAFREIHAPQGSAERRESVQRSGGRTSVPQIFIAGRHIGGCDDLEALDRAGKLDPLLRAA